jgi:hypothetical protein
LWFAVSCCTYALGVEKNTKSGAGASVIRVREHQARRKYAMAVKNSDSDPTIIGRISASLILLHEIGHAYRHQYENVIVSELKAFGKTDPYAVLKEENEVVRRFENPGAIILGEFNRPQYLPGDYYQSKNVTSTEPKQD